MKFFAPTATRVNFPKRCHCLRVQTIKIRLYFVRV